MTRLIIAEKPDMGKQIASVLNQPHKKGDGFIETAEGTVTWCIGHILELMNPEGYDPDWKLWKFENLPMIPKDWKYSVTSSKAKQFKVIKELLKNATEIVNAGDPGREGQLIVDEVLHYLNNKKPVKRILLHSLDNQSVLKAFANLEDNTKFYPIYQAGLARGYADWLMGLNATRAYTLLGQKKGYKGVLSVGRVQSPTLAIVVNRDETIENFIPKDYYTINGLFNKDNAGFKAYWKPQENITPEIWLDDEKRLINKEEAESIANKIKLKNATVKQYEEKDGEEGPPLPFSLSELQGYASAKWGMGAKQILDTCQSLYEKKLQSYPRTDCTYIPEVLHREASIISANIGASIPALTTAANNANLSLKSKAWNDKKVAESEHYGLIPTKEIANFNSLNGDEQKIYKAVCERYLAQFYPPCLYRAATIDIICENELFKATGKVIKDLGWKAVFKEQIEEPEENENSDEEEQIFPNIKTGDVLICSNSTMLCKLTKPPSRFTEGTLLKAMKNVHTLVSDPVQKKKLRETKGIGQEATRTQIIETLFKRELLLKKGKQVISSDAGRALIHALPTKVTDPALTAVWENALEQIAKGNLTLEVFIDKQSAWVRQLIEQAKTSEISVAASPAKENKQYSKPYAKPSTTKTSTTKTTSKTATKSKAGGTGTCPKCGVGEMQPRVAKASGKKFLGCSNFPKCNHSIWEK